MKTQPIDTNRKTRKPQVLTYICLLALLLTRGETVLRPMD